jgi:hypothetical protein
MLLSEGQRVEVILLPQTLLKHFDLLLLFRVVRDEATPPVLCDDATVF